MTAERHQADGQAEMREIAERIIADTFKHHVLGNPLYDDEREPLLANITAALQAAVAAEREACAAVADGFTCGGCGMDGKAGAAIRARTAPNHTGD